MVGIYKITNPKGESYIGQTNNVSRRKNNYKYPQSGNLGTLILQSILKYGFENHSFEVLEECKVSDLPQREKYWIKKFNTYKNGLNMNKGGGGSISHSKKIRKLISKNGKGKGGRSISQYNLKNQFVATFPTIKSAEDIYGLGIKGVLAGKTFTAGGYIWRYEEDPLPSDYKLEKYSCRKKPLLQMSLEGEIIKEWDSLTEVENILGYPTSNISACCLGKQKTAYGFKWEFKN